MASVQATVLLDSYRWHETYGDASSPVLEAAKGDKISVSADEFERGAAMTPPGLAKPSSKSAKAAANEADTADDTAADE